jgi:radical SAM protein with 4Fe4S-binding SPASM domain
MVGFGLVEIQEVASAHPTGTNGSQIDQSIIELLSRYRIQIIVPVFLTNIINQGNYLTNLLVLLKKNNVIYTITIVHLEDNINNISSLKLEIPETSPDHSQIAVIYNKPRDLDGITYMQLIKTPRRINAHIYYHMKEHHPCLWGTISMSVTGDILPCPYLRKEILGNVGNSRWLEHIFENQSIYDYWDLSLSNIDRCRDCAFQLGCLDCRALEMHITGDLYGKQLCCLGKINQE